MFVFGWRKLWCGASLEGKLMYVFHDLQDNNCIVRVRSLSSHRNMRSCRFPKKYRDSGIIRFQNTLIIVTKTNITRYSPVNEHSWVENSPCSLGNGWNIFIHGPFSRSDQRRLWKRRISLFCPLWLCGILALRVCILQRKGHDFHHVTYQVASWYSYGSTSFVVKFDLPANLHEDIVIHVTGHIKIQHALVSNSWGISSILPLWIF